MVPLYLKFVSLFLRLFEKSTFFRLMAVPATVVYFTMYDQLKARMIKKYSLTYQPLWIPALAGGLARSKILFLF